MVIKRYSRVIKLILFRFLDTVTQRQVVNLIARIKCMSGSDSVFISPAGDTVMHQMRVWGVERKHSSEKLFVQIDWSNDANMQETITGKCPNYVCSEIKVLNQHWKMKK